MLDIGYHIIIDRDGTPHCIRPVDAIGSHTPGRNHDTLGIALMGGVTEEGDFENNFTARQLDTLAYLMAAAKKDWPDVGFVHRQQIQRRRGDPKALPFEIPTPAAPPWNSLTEMILYDDQGRRPQRAAAARARILTSAADPDPDDRPHQPRDRQPDLPSGGTPTPA